MNSLVLLLAGATAAPTPALRGAFMNCGSAVLCGVLTLETGLGPGNYKHSGCATHGLWPEVGSYGSSKCVKPTGARSDPSTVYSCYKQSGDTSSDLLTFEAHEWEKHGQCAGVKVRS